LTHEYAWPNIHPSPFVLLFSHT